MQKGRGSDEAKVMLPRYGGGLGSDSLGAWNHVGEWHQKCHLHYKRDLERTMQEKVRFSDTFLSDTKFVKYSNWYGAALAVGSFASHLIITRSLI